MKETTNSISPAQGIETWKKDSDIVFITILRGDRDWINKTKCKLNREERLHEIIQMYRGEFGE